LRPNLAFIRADGSTFFEINEVGLKGGSIDPSRKLVVVWGDSVVFGIGPGWPCLLDRLAPGYQFLNGGIEGDSYRSVLARMAEFNRQQPVALNILLLLWLIQMVQGRGRAWLGLFRRIWSRRRVWGWHCALQGKR
jgi:hypothetical protein